LKDNSDSGLPGDFLLRLTESNSSNGLDKIFHPVFYGLVQDMSNTNLLGSFMDNLRGLAILVKHRPAAALLPSLSNWINPAREPNKGAEIELYSFLGPFFRLSAVHNTEVAAHYFPDVLVRTNNFENNLSTLRTVLRGASVSRIAC
jgi:hypothetical protein